MKLRNVISGALFALGAAALPAAVYADKVEIEINTAPPPPVKVEVNPPAPRTGYIYEPGHYEWDRQGQKYVWQDSRFLQERQGFVYEPSTLEKRGDLWIYKEGGWQEKK